MKKIPIVGADQWRLKADLGRASLYAMYASTTGCITTDPMVMTVPVDDHLVHRGDGVFESFKCVEGSMYNLDAHLRRLEVSCLAIGLSLPVELHLLKEVLVQTVRAGGQKMRWCVCWFREVWVQWELILRPVQESNFMWWYIH